MSGDERVAGDVLRLARSKSGLTQRGLAAAAGVAQPTIAAYESGRRQPTLPVLWGLLRAAGWEPRIDLATCDHAPTDAQRVALAELAPRIRAAQGHDAALRHLIGFVDAARRQDAIVDVDTEPKPTGDPRWDAMLAAVAEMVARERGRLVPAWAAAPARFLDRWWFPVADALGRLPTGLAVYALTHSPGPFAARGIMLDADTFTSV